MGLDGFTQGCTEFHKEKRRKPLPSSNGKFTLTPDWIGERKNFATQSKEGAAA
jgi:hypothetical protein